MNSLYVLFKKEVQVSAIVNFGGLQNSKQYCANVSFPGLLFYWSEICIREKMRTT